MSKEPKCVLCGGNMHISGFISRYGKKVWVWKCDDQLCPYTIDEEQMENEG